MCQYTVTLRERETDRELKIKECLMVKDISVIPGMGKEIYEISILGEIMYILKSVFLSVTNLAKNKLNYYYGIYT